MSANTWTIAAAHITQGANVSGLSIIHITP